uniref:Uncharacterized protein n=1 Tax=Arundo donax TaxID=35708 RepID=A0A0A9CWU4_ARUDO
MQHTEEGQVHCRHGLMHQATMLEVKVQDILIQSPGVAQQLCQKSATAAGQDLEISLFSWRARGGRSPAARGRRGPAPAAPPTPSSCPWPPGPARGLRWPQPARRAKAARPRRKRAE